MSLLTICIPTTPERKAKLARLMNILKPQADRFGCKILVYETPHVDNGGLPTGTKRNELISQVKTDYAAFIDSDDLIHPSYMELVHNGLKTGVDGIGFKGIITTNSKNPCEFRHSKNFSYRDYKLGGKTIYERPLNHVNPMRTDFFIACPFPDLTYSEDKIQCELLQKSGLIKTEVYINEFLYEYLWIPTIIKDK